jgi:hypothetical protein
VQNCTSGNKYSGLEFHAEFFRRYPFTAFIDEAFDRLTDVSNSIGKA